MDILHAFQLAAEQSLTTSPALALLFAPFAAIAFATVTFRAVEQVQALDWSRIARIFFDTGRARAAWKFATCRKDRRCYVTAIVSLIAATRIATFSEITEKIQNARILIRRVDWREIGAYGAAIGVAYVGGITVGALASAAVGTWKIIDWETQRHIRDSARDFQHANHPGLDDDHPVRLRQLLYALDKNRRARGRLETNWQLGIIKTTDAGTVINWTKHVAHNLREQIYKFDVSDRWLCRFERLCFDLGRLKSRYERNDLDREQVRAAKKNLYAQRRILLRWIDQRHGTDFRS